MIKLFFKLLVISSIFVFLFFVYFNTGDLVFEVSGTSIETTVFLVTTCILVIMGIIFTVMKYFMCIYYMFGRKTVENSERKNFSNLIAILEKIDRGKITKNEILKKKIVIKGKELSELLTNLYGKIN